MMLGLGLECNIFDAALHLHSHVSRAPCVPHMHFTPRKMDQMPSNYTLIVRKKRGNTIPRANVGKLPLADRSPPRINVLR